MRASAPGSAWPSGVKTVEYNKQSFGLGFRCAWARAARTTLTAEVKAATSRIPHKVCDRKRRNECTSDREELYRAFLFLLIFDIHICVVISILTLFLVFFFLIIFRDKV